MSDTGGYIRLGENYLLCVHCVDHIHKDLLAPIKKDELEASFVCHKCGRSLKFALERGPIGNANS